MVNLHPCTKSLTHTATLKSYSTPLFYLPSFVTLLLNWQWKNVPSPFKIWIQTFGNEWQFLHFWQTTDIHFLHGRKQYWHFNSTSAYSKENVWWVKAEESVVINSSENIIFTTSFSILSHHSSILTLVVPTADPLVRTKEARFCPHCGITLELHPHLTQPIHF